MRTLVGVHVSSGSEGVEGSVEAYGRDRRRDILHVEGYAGDRLALHDLLGDVMNATVILPEVCRFIHLDVLANLGDDIHQELGAHPLCFTVRHFKPRLSNAKVMRLDSTLTCPSKLLAPGPGPSLCTCIYRTMHLYVLCTMYIALSLSLSPFTRIDLGA